MFVRTRGNPNIAPVYGLGGGLFFLSWLLPQGRVGCDPASQSMPGRFQTIHRFNRNSSAIFSSTNPCLTPTQTSIGP
jgi:hypothetical protein